MIPSDDELYAALAERHGYELQAKFSAASVVICGLGGLGSNIALMLARAGIGKLCLIDFDRVDISNLNRQQYFPDQLGMFKTKALLSTVSRAAPICSVTECTVRLSEENAVENLSGYDIVCEAFDNAESKAMLVNCVLEKLPQSYLVCANGMAGIGSSNDIRTRRFSERAYICGDGKSDVSDGHGLFSARAALCAAHQANMILRIISGIYDA